MSLQGQWPRFVLFVLAVCALPLAERAAAQEDPVAVARDDEPWRPDETLPPSDRFVPEELVPPPDAIADDLSAPPSESDTPANADDQVLPLPDREPLQGSDEQLVPEPEIRAAQPLEQELPLPDPQLAVGTSTAISNEDVRAMANAQFSESTMLAAIAANPASFDVSPRALVALKSAGVPERVIEAMINSESAKRETPDAGDEAAVAEAAVSVTAASAAMPSEEFTKLSTMIEQLAAQQEAAIAARREPEPPRSADPSPHAWIVQETDKTALAPTIAQVAFTEERGAATFKTLHGLANKALAFANPAVSGIATTIGGLFKPNDDDQTAVWALAGTSAARELGSTAVFEVEFGNIPGVDPDKYRPAIVRLVRTNDNYRLVAAAKTEGAKKSVPSGPIIEETVATELTQLGRGRYRAATRETLGAGEYALVLRPVTQKERPKRKSSEASLGELLGGGTSQILYFTWDFSVATL